jgi:hypothetical protein
MDRKRGKVLVGAVVAVTMGAFAVPFCANASVSTGTTTPRQNSGLIQLAEEEHTEIKEKTEAKVNQLGEKTENKANEMGERTEDKAHELKSDAVAVPNAVHEEHEEHEAAEASAPEEHGGMRHEMKENAENHADEMGHEVKGAANAVKSEHEEHEAREMMNDR